MQIVIATTNQGKLRELRTLLSAQNIILKTPNDFRDFPEVAETGKTFAENAILKAESARDFTGLPALADDSGLAVDYLNGAPGVFSARYAGEKATDADNNHLLLTQLENVPREKRRAKFVCVIAYAVPEKPTQCFYGETNGYLLTAPQGENGFGYDPLFFSDDLQGGFATATAAQKNQVSHRGRALLQLVKYWGELT